MWDQQKPTSSDTRMTIRTPEAISVDVREFCRRVNHSADPVYISVTPELDCAVNDCFQSVRLKVVRSGGRIQFGWSIWEWPRVYLEAVHHAVYQPPDGGRLIDITPEHLPEIRRRLFLPDDTAVYDFENEGVLRQNIRFALCDDPLVQDLFTAAARRVSILNSIPGVGEVEIEIETAEQLRTADEDVARATFRLGMKYTS